MYVRITLSLQRERGVCEGLSQGIGYSSSGLRSGLLESRILTISPNPD